MLESCLSVFLFLFESIFCDVFVLYQFRILSASNSAKNVSQKHTLQQNSGYFKQR